MTTLADLRAERESLLRRINARRPGVLVLRARLREVTHEIDGYQFTRLISHFDFATEGAVQRHCIGAYAGRAKFGRLVAFKIEGRERATFSSFDTRHIDQIKGFANSKVSKPCHKAADVALKKFADAQRDAA